MCESLFYLISLLVNDSRLFKYCTIFIATNDIYKEYDMTQVHYTQKLKGKKKDMR